MTTTLGEDAIVLAGQCGVEEVEDLLLHLENRPDLPVDITAATAIHTALWQALMIFGPSLVGAPQTPFIAMSVVPALQRYREEKAAG